MVFPKREIVEKIRKEYPVGCEVVLDRIEDMQAPPVGTHGIVKSVDDTGSIKVAWRTGGSLRVVYGEDACRKLDAVKTVCYGKEDVWDSRKEAADFFLRAIAGSEGSECERYTKIYTELLMGKSVCTDGE